MQIPGVPDRFTVQESLGRGAFGEVYRARDAERDETVALKILRRQSPEAMFRFKREFRALADVHHPNLVRLFELHQNDDVWLLSMEHLEGESLALWLGLETNTPLTTQPPTESDAAVRSDRSTHRPPPTWAKVFIQLVTGVQALHDTGWLHRDLKPSNVIVTREDRKSTRLTPVT